MIIQLSIDIEIEKDTYEDEDIKKIIDKINETEYATLGHNITASWQNFEKYEYNNQDWD